MFVAVGSWRLWSAYLKHLRMTSSYTSTTLTDTDTEHPDRARRVFGTICSHSKGFVTANKLVIASPHRCDHLPIASGTVIQPLWAAASPIKISRVEPLHPSSIGGKSDDKDNSKQDCCAIDSASDTCCQCHTWLYKNKFQEHMAIATGNIRDGSLLHISEIRTLMHCTARGCQLCHTILDSIRLQVKVELPDQEPLSSLTRYSLYLLPDVPGWTIKIVFQTPLGVVQTDLRLVPCDRIKSEDSSDTPQWALDTTSVVDDDDDDDDDDGESKICFQRPQEDCAYQLDTKSVVAQIKTWVENCKSHDQRCCGRSRGYSKQGHPFRLIFLGDEHAPCPRLVDANITMDAGIEYVTMSHRWDSSTKATETTRTNVLSAYQNISLDSYPEHFKEAISLTKRLGFKYMWIDSVCIIQDCREDWSEQATLMHQIYSNGALNLALLQSFTDGIPAGQVRRDDPNAEVLGCRLRIFDAPGSSTGELICWKPENFDHVLQTSNLYSRGWTFQERLLSPRTVHFGQKQLYWECCSRRASTTFPQTVDYPCQFADKFVLNFKQLTPDPDQDEFAGKLHGTWCSVVRDYSARDFTKPSDRLVALSGVAEQLRHIYSLGNDEYFYGLWKPCLPEQLLWGIEGVTQRAKLDQTNAGPSWSWVSHIHPTRFVNMYLGSEGFRQRLATFIGLHEVIDGKVLGVSVNLSASYSKNTSAILRLKGILIPLKHSTSSTTIALEFDCSAYELRSRPDTYLLPILRDIDTIYGLVLQGAGVEGDITHSCSGFRRAGLFHCGQNTIEETLYARRPSMESSLDWTTLLHLHASELALIS